ncbi:MAG: hypothetical protein U1D30_25385 [Planctomycetota bacterium]
MNGPYFLDASVLSNDERAVDHLFGEEGADWIIFDNEVDNSFDPEPQDILTTLSLL